MVYDCVKVVLQNIIILFYSCNCTGTMADQIIYIYIYIIKLFEHLLDFTNFVKIIHPLHKN